jgi:hypothetical protein
MSTLPKAPIYSIAVGIDYSGLSDLALERPCESARADAPHMDSVRVVQTGVPKQTAHLSIAGRKGSQTCLKS